MSEVARLTLVSHGMTDAMAAGRFPLDEPLSPVGRRQVEALELASADLVTCGPERRTRQTAELLGLVAAPDARLADLDHGAWRGRTLDAVPPEDLRTWLTEPGRAPHGGESITDLVTRVHGWLDEAAQSRTRQIAVTHPAVVRAAVLSALRAPAESFWRIDVAPAGRTVLHFRGAWTLRC